MKKLIAPMLTILFTTFLCQVAAPEGEGPARRPGREGRQPPQVGEARELAQRLRDLNRELRDAIAAARQDEEVRKAFETVSRQQQALWKAQGAADEALEKAIVANNADLADKVAERKAVRKKMQELRERFTRRRMGSPGPSQDRPDTPPSRQAEVSPTQVQAKRVIPTIVHFEILADDVERAKKFYTELFGWKFDKMPGPMEYWVISVTKDKDAKAIDGGMMKRQPRDPGYRNYIAVPSVEDYSVRVKKLGGRVVLPKMAVPGFGYFAVCLDTENNCFAIWETDESAK